MVGDGSWNIHKIRKIIGIYSLLQRTLLDE